MAQSGTSLPITYSTLSESCKSDPISLLLKKDLGHFVMAMDARTVSATHNFLKGAHPEPGCAKVRFQAQRIWDTFHRKVPIDKGHLWHVEQMHIHVSLELFKLGKVSTKLKGAVSTLHPHFPLI